MSHQPTHPRARAQQAFASAVILLFLSALVVYFTMVRLMASEKWVVHTYEVQAALGEIDSALAKSGRACAGYLATGNDDFSKAFDLAAPEVPQKLQHLRELIKDNSDQRDLWSRLEEATDHRVGLFQEAIELKKNHPGDEQGQRDVARQGLPFASSITAIMQQMRDREQHLLTTRAKSSNRWFAVAVITLTLTFLLALMLFSVHYRLLWSELEAREQAERTARTSEQSLRRLTARLLQLQDEERRKFSRELHDSLGQYLASVKMTLDMFSKTQPTDRLLAEAKDLLDQSIAETRTISHLLHPPLLDETGFSSAAKWYLEGFAQRSGVTVKLDLPADRGRLPRPVELGLFRVLQEGLTNIHRHSGSSKAEVHMAVLADQVTLTVRDFGKGIPHELLQSIRANGASAGVGLAGMRERIRELGGQLDIRSSNPGILISVTIPLRDNPDAVSASAAD